MKTKINYTAFTLAEVLITLGIIGIVASLTIPTIIQKQREIATVTALKKVQSTFSQAFLLATQENGAPETWGMINATTMISPILKYLNVTKNCALTAGCAPDIINNISKTSTQNYNTDSARYKFILNDGMQVMATYNDSTCTAWTDVCGSILVDINGFKQPNTKGLDVFGFYLTKTGIRPIGLQNDLLYPFQVYCKDKSYSNIYNGNGCAAWVIYNENMDYLHCSDLSWTGKKTCN